MKRFETVIRIYNRGRDPLEAAEKAGEVFDTSMMDHGMTLICEPAVRTRSVKGRTGVAKGENEFVTVFRIQNEGEDTFDAGERAGEIVDMSKIDDMTDIYCLPTRCLRGEICHAEERYCGGGYDGSFRGKDMPLMAPA